MTVVAIILLYHRIAVGTSDPWNLNVSPANFAAHLEVLTRRRRPASLQDIVDTTNEDRPERDLVTVTFDDGYADNLNEALPALTLFSVPATFYLTSRSLGTGREFWWDELDRVLLHTRRLPRQLSVAVDGEPLEADLGTSAEVAGEAVAFPHWRAWESPPTPRHELYVRLWKRLQAMRDDRRGRVLEGLRNWAGIDKAENPRHRSMSRVEAAALARSDLSSIGAHTRTHAQLTTLSLDDQREEIAGCKQDLEMALMVPVTSFSYPYGKRSDYNHETMDIVRDAGYASACVNWSGPVDRTSDRFELPRVFVQDMTGPAFEQWLETVDIRR